VLTLQNIELQLGNEPSVKPLLHDISLSVPSGHLAAVVGPSGCGKTSLLKVIAGVHEPSRGEVLWAGRDLSEEDLAPSEMGYVPQFSIAYDHLSIAESIEIALRLRVNDLSRRERNSYCDSLLDEVGLGEIASRRVKVLSGGEKRRLALALELVTRPALLLCDEVTSGLDPKSESEIVTLLHRLSREQSRIVISVTHSMRHLEAYDSVIVLFQGQLVYHGSGHGLGEFFETDSAEDVFLRLSEHDGDYWRQQWHARSASIRSSPEPDETTERHDASRIDSVSASNPTQATPVREEDALGDNVQTLRQPVRTPGILTQVSALLTRQWKIFLRDRGQLYLQLALILGFPCLVVVFALRGLPQMRSLSMGSDVGVVQQLIETNELMLETTRVGSLVSGLIMIQVILLSLMGANNAARMIAAERSVFETERLGGLRAESYVLSKLGFLIVLVAAQSVWMAVFVSSVCRFPGNFIHQIALLVLANGAMTSICLGISSVLKSPEQASLVSVYLVGFQLPLSGALLALPQWLSVIVRPFISAYWSWSGVLQTMRDSRFYDAVLNVTQTSLSILPVCVWVLVVHCILGIVVAYCGCKHSRWE